MNKKKWILSASIAAVVIAAVVLAILFWPRARGFHSDAPVVGTVTVKVNGQAVEPPLVSELSVQDPADPSGELRRLSVVRDGEALHFSEAQNPGAVNYRLTLPAGDGKAFPDIDLPLDAALLTELDMEQFDLNLEILLENTDEEWHITMNLSAADRADSSNTVTGSSFFTVEEYANLYVCI